MHFCRPDDEVEGLKTAERQGVVDVIKETVLAMFGPTVQPFPQFIDDIAEVGHRALFRLQRIDPFNFPSINTREKLKRNCLFSLVGSSENGLIVKSRASWPTFR
jgi:hypothetical protein